MKGFLAALLVLSLLDLKAQEWLSMLSCRDTVVYFDNACTSVYEIDIKAPDLDTVNGSMDWEIRIDFESNGILDVVYTSLIPSNTIPGTLASTFDPPLYTYDNAQLFYIPKTKVAEHVLTLSDELLSIFTEVNGTYEELKHRIYYRVIAPRGNSQSCIQSVYLQDTIKVFADFKQESYEICVDTSEHAVEICCTCTQANNTIYAKDYVLRVEDNCGNEWISYFQDTPPVKDTLVRVGQIFLPVNLNIPHFFDSRGFVDFAEGPDTYPAPKNSTIAAFHRGDIQLWHPDLRTSSMEESACFIPYCLGDLSVSVEDQSFNKTTSNIRTFNTYYCDGSMTTSTSRIETNNRVNVYPNPFTDILSIEVQAMPYPPHSFSIRDWQGRILKNGSISNEYLISIPTDNLPEGLYILEMHFEHFSISEKVVKM